MEKLLSIDDFKEKLNNKKQEFLNQKEEKIQDIIASILKWSWIILDNYPEFNKNKILEWFRMAAENSEKYKEDYLIDILKNFENNIEEYKYWEQINFDWNYNSFWNINNDIVYQRMMEKWDTENIKLFLERKLPVDTYYSYLTEAELKDLWNEYLWLLNEQLVNDVFQSVEKTKNTEDDHNIDIVRLKKSFLDALTNVMDNWLTISQKEVSEKFPITSDHIYRSIRRKMKNFRPEEKRWFVEQWRKNENFNGDFVDFDYNDEWKIKITNPWVYIIKFLYNDIDGKTEKWEIKLEVCINKWDTSDTIIVNPNWEQKEPHKSTTENVVVEKELDSTNETQKEMNDRFLMLNARLEDLRNERTSIIKGTNNTEQTSSISAIDDGNTNDPLVNINEEIKKCEAEIWKINKYFDKINKK